MQIGLTNIYALSNIEAIEANISILFYAFSLSLSLFGWPKSSAKWNNEQIHIISTIDHWIRWNEMFE